MSAALRQRLADAMAHPPVLIGHRQGFDLFERGDLLVAVPSLPADGSSWALAAVDAARSCLLDGRCAVCGTEPHLTQRWGLRAWHDAGCPGYRIDRPTKEHHHA